MGNRPFSMEKKQPYEWIKAQDLDPVPLLVFEKSLIYKVFGLFEVSVKKTLKSFTVSSLVTGTHENKAKTGIFNHLAQN